VEQLGNFLYISNFISDFSRQEEKIWQVRHISSRMCGKLGLLKVSTIVTLFPSWDIPIRPWLRNPKCSFLSWARLHPSAYMYVASLPWLCQVCLVHINQVGKTFSKHKFLVVLFLWDLTMWCGHLLQEFLLLLDMTKGQGRQRRKGKDFIPKSLHTVPTHPQANPYYMWMYHILKKALKTQDKSQETWSDVKAWKDREPI